MVGLACEGRKYFMGIDGTLSPSHRPHATSFGISPSIKRSGLFSETRRDGTRNASDHLLTGLLFDDVGHRMVPTHATKAGVRYRYYVSFPHLHGESRTALVGSVSRVPASDIENVIVRSLNEHLIAQMEKPTSSLSHVGDGKATLERVAYRCA